MLTLHLGAEEQLGYHASGRSAAMFEENYGDPATVALNTASRSYHEAAGVLSDRGILMLGHAKNKDAFHADKKGLKLEDITVSEACDLVPVLNRRKVERAAYDPGASDIDTHALLQSFRADAMKLGVQINTKSQVTKIARINTGWEVDTSQTCYFARHIINAAGAWVDQIAEMAGIAPLGFQPYRRSMARLPAPGGLEVSGWPMLFGPGESWYAKPDAGAWIVSPAEEDPVEAHDAYADDMTLAEGLMRYEEHVVTPVVRLLASWAGLRTFAPDRTLVLGPDPKDAKFIWCAGQGGYGMQSAPGASQMLADLIGGATPMIERSAVNALSPARFTKGAA